MQTRTFTITQHRNGYIEIQDENGNLIQTADTVKEALTDIKQLESEAV